MTFAADPLAEAILAELRDIRVALQTTATAYTKMVRIVEEGRGTARVSSPPPADSSEPKKKREPVDPKDILSVTGYVLHFGQAVNAATNEPKLTKKGKKPYWTLKLTNGFIANVFSTSQAKVCIEAYDEQKPLIIDYVKEGNYSNIESLKIGAAQAEEREPGEDDDDESPF